MKMQARVEAARCSLNTSARTGLGRPGWDNVFLLIRALMGDTFSNAVSRPRLATWVARTTKMLEALPAVSEPLGQVEAMSRSYLNWLIAIPVDGSMPLGGVAPCSLPNWCGKGWRRNPLPCVPR